MRVLQDLLLDELGILRKSTIGSVMSVCSLCPSTWNKSAPTGRIFVILDIWVFFENLSLKFEFFLNLARTADTLRKELWKFMTIHLAEFSLEWELLQTKFVKNIKTHILCSTIFCFQKSCRLWYNVKICKRRAIQATHDNVAHALLRAGFLRLKSHT